VHCLNWNKISRLLNRRSAKYSQFATGKLAIFLAFLFTQDSLLLRWASPKAQLDLTGVSLFYLQHTSPLPRRRCPPPPSSSLRLLLSRRYAPFERPITIAWDAIRLSPNPHRRPFHDPRRRRRRRVGLSSVPIERPDSDREMILSNLWFPGEPPSIGGTHFLARLVNLHLIFQDGG
jgi:hypothetical protein